MLTSLIAQEIARDTSAIIGFNVLITDRDGVVIGSGDTDRLGSFHEASVDVMRTLRATSHGPAAAHRLVGVQPGITLPILLNNEAVGTVGITGDPDQVQRFGQVVRNQTEILLRESLLLRSRLLREGALEDLLRDLAHFDPQVTEPDFIAFKAHELGYDLRLRRTAVVIGVVAPPGSANRPDAGGLHLGGPPMPSGESTTLQTTILRVVRRAFADPQDLVGCPTSGRFVVLHHPAGTADSTVELLARCREIAADLMRPNAVAAGLTCRVGVGGTARSVAQLHESYRDATNALYLSSRLARNERVAYIGDMRIHDLLATVAPPARARFASTVAGRLRDQPDWTVTRTTITAWCESGFNLVRASAALRIHRNTLVYRLSKIEGVVGRSIREPRDCLNLYLACLVDELEVAD